MPCKKLSDPNIKPLHPKFSPLVETPFSESASNPQELSREWTTTTHIAMHLDYYKQHSACMWMTMTHITQIFGFLVAHFCHEECDLE
jgi:hypothetical protein